MGSRERKIILIIALIVAAAVIAAVCIYMSPESPAEENASVSPAASASAAQAGTGGSVIISELMEKNRAVLRDEDGDFSDWIELHNVSDKAVSLGGWRISDKSGEPGWAFPEATIEPGGIPARLCLR
ncbi:MAG: lamin tail domain-containing protein [Oscillospiraceae bacterium]